MNSAPHDTAEAGADLATSLLSIDVDRELHKILERRFRSPEQYLVELVRAACARGARRIEVELGARGVTLRDDGAPLALASVRHLERLLDRARPSEERQAALAALDDEEGSGLLAALACRPGRLELHSGDGRGGLGLELSRSRPRLFDRPYAGTRLHLARRGAPGRERALLHEAAAHASVDIVVNGAPVSRRSLRGLAQAPLLLPSGAGTATLAIPDDDDLCHATRLRHGLRVDEQVRQAVAGLVFELVFEGPAGWPDDLWSRGADLAGHLYQDLVQHYASLPPTSQARVDTLMFVLHRHQPGHPLFGFWAPFQVLGLGRRWDLAQVQVGVHAGALTALVTSADPRHHDTRGSVLWLTPAQREFLVEQVRLPLAAPLAAPRPPRWWQHLPGRAHRGWRALLERGAPTTRSRVERNALTVEQRALVEAMQQALASGRWQVPGVPASATVVVSDVRSRVPLRGVAGRAEPSPSELLVYRRHAQVAQAARALARDPDNLRLVLAALRDGEDSWVEAP